ncbi:DMT family transporter [Lactiplantibacillus garii]|uniref:DMT family transporter n=1 Tax=Lactiplantibacillus garii TaxID=2306423 RepID=A0A426D799_9LACO|nr:DMT family transporter [Lactiplantibacillus garii]RRK10479.1 DMT family transporter [Lactiplantibacillus garii]
MLAMLIGLTIGLGLPIQTGLNSRLRRSVGSPFLASLASFTLGTLFLAVVTLLAEHQLGFSPNVFTTAPAWIWLGGLFGVIYLTGNILLFPKLGSVQTVIMPVLGQILMGLLVDNFGWFGASVARLTVSRVLGAGLVLGGVLITVALNPWLENHHHPVTTARGSHKGWWRLVGVFTGMLSASQTAVNGHLGLVLGSSLQAALTSFLMGMLILLVIVLATRTPFKLTQPDGRPNPWWMWVGGALGALYVLGNVVLVQLVGTGLAVVIVLVGLMAGSLLIDQFGWLQAPRHPVTLVQLGGLLVMIIGVAVIRLL